MRHRGVRHGLMAAIVAAFLPPALAAQVPVGRQAAEALRFEELDFDPPEAEEHTLSNGVPVLFLRDPGLPLVTVFARFSGGYSHFPREYYAASSALASMVRNGGTATLPPDSVDRLLEHYAIQTSFGSGGQSVFSTLNVLTRHLDVALGLWVDILRNPGFDSSRVEVWRGQELESVLRRRDDPGRLAFSAFNHLMYGDHPIGWEMAAGDLDPDDLSRARLEWVHARVMCPGNLVLGVTGDVTWDELRPRLERAAGGWTPCPDTLPEPPEPTIRHGGGVFLIPKALEQSTVVLAHATPVRQNDDEAFFASRIGNSILGASGFSSRLMSRLRTEEGYAYSASSLWTAPRESDGLVGALTRTRAGSTIAAVELILEVIDGMRDAAPAREEVESAIEEIVNGFVFAFESPAQIVSRQMLYRAEGLPRDWLERYIDGIQEVTPRDVHRVFRRHVRPEEMVILILGDPEAFDRPPGVLGEVTILPLEGDVSPGATRPGG